MAPWKDCSRDCASFTAVGSYVPRPKYMSDEIAFWLPNLSRAAVGASSAAEAEEYELMNTNVRERWQIGACGSLYLGLDVVAAAEAAAAVGIAPKPNLGNGAA